MDINNGNRIAENDYTDPTATYDNGSNEVLNDFSSFSSTYDTAAYNPDAEAGKPETHAYQDAPAVNGQQTPQQSAYAAYNNAQALAQNQGYNYAQQPQGFASPVYNAQPSYGQAPTQPHPGYAPQQGYSQNQYQQPAFNAGPAPAPYTPQPAPSVYPKSKGVALLLAFFLGCFGAHNFYLGFTGKAVAQVLLTIVGVWFFFLGPVVAWIWVIVEMIQLAVSTPGSIHNKDARGVDLVWWN